MKYRSRLSVAKGEEVRENYESSRKVIIEILDSQEYVAAFKLEAVEMLMRLDAMYTGGFDPGKHHDEQSESA